MKLACIHTHTDFCDGEGSVEDFCAAAYEKGLIAVGFSAHAPLKRAAGIVTDWNMRADLLEPYLEAVAEAKRRWEGRLEVYAGLEVDHIGGIMGPGDRDYYRLGLDYVIGSVHFVFPERGRPFTVDDTAEAVAAAVKESYGGDGWGMVEDYYRALETMILFGGFDVIGHPDLVKKNNADSRFFSEEAPAYRKLTARIARAAGVFEVTAEVNTGGMSRGAIKDCYPSAPFMALFKAEGVPLVINADAHRPEHLDAFYPDARRAMLAAGYTETALFAGRMGGRGGWEGEWV